MNKNRSGTKDGHKSFLLLSEIEKEERLSQRELANRLGLALGLVNSYIKNLVSKGFVRVKTFPHNRYGYLLTPSGVAEKGRLAYQHLNYFTSLYTVTRNDYLEMFRGLQARGIKSVMFCGVDEVAEIAYLSLREVGLDLAVVMDTDEYCEGLLFGVVVVPLSEGICNVSETVVITSLKRGAGLREKLREIGWRGSLYGPPSLAMADQGGRSQVLESHT
jgi:DNA-binding MarR family transcriptional regulator